jgi:hypothetical protein
LDHTKRPHGRSHSLVDPGRFRTGYAGKTLRDHLDLKRPAAHRATN